MRNSRNLVNNRREHVMELIKDTGRVKVEMLAELFEVSRITVRRDLQFLEDEGKLERFYGGATQLSASKIGNQNELIYYRKSIAKYAARMIEDGDTIFINTSSTALLVMKYIKAKQVTVITNNGKALNMEHSPEVSVILSGGEVRGAKEAMVGEFAINNISRVYAKKCFLGCSGISIHSGMTTENLNEVSINEQMCKHVMGNIYILADHIKLGHESSFVSCPLNKITHVITDEKASNTIVRDLMQHGINVVCVGKNDNPEDV